MSTPTVRELLDEFALRAPDLVAYTTVDAADLGAPTTRRRVIAGPAPAMIERLRETPVQRVSVADAFAAAGVNTLPTRTAGEPLRRDRVVECYSWNPYVSQMSGATTYSQ